MAEYWEANEVWGGEEINHDVHGGRCLKEEEDHMGIFVHTKFCSLL
jgi:hypothetical protein